MRKYVLCYGLALLLLISGCSDGDHTTANHSSTTTATTKTYSSSSMVTTTATTHLPTSTHIDATTHHSANTSIPNTTTTINGTHSGRHSNDASLSSTTTLSPTLTNGVTFKAVVRDYETKAPVAGVTVKVYTNQNTSPAGNGITDNNGIVRFNIAKATTYRVVLDTLPFGYEADTEYLFSTNTVNITIRKKPVQNELDHSGAQYDVGMSMTDFELTDTDGKSYRLSNLLKEKRLVILDFWFATCEPCKLEFPFFEAAVQTYGDHIALLAVNPFDSMSTIRSLRNQLNGNTHTKITFPMLQDTCQLYLGFEVFTYPTTIFIDENGQILNIHFGTFPSEAAFLATIERYLYE